MMNVKDAIEVLTAMRVDKVGRERAHKRQNAALDVALATLRGVEFAQECEQPQPNTWTICGARMGEPFVDHVEAATAAAASAEVQVRRGYETVIVAVFRGKLNHEE